MKLIPHSVGNGDSPPCPPQNPKSRFGAQEHPGTATFLIHSLWSLKSLPGVKRTQKMPNSSQNLEKPHTNSPRERWWLPGTFPFSSCIPFHDFFKVLGKTFGRSQTQGLRLRWSKSLGQIRPCPLPTLCGERIFCMGNKSLISRIFKESWGFRGWNLPLILQELCPKENWKRPWFSKVWAWRDVGTPEGSSNPWKSTRISSRSLPELDKYMGMEVLEAPNPTDLSLLGFFPKNKCQYFLCPALQTDKYSEFTNNIQNLQMTSGMNELPTFPALEKDPLEWFESLIPYSSFAPRRSCYTEVENSSLPSPFHHIPVPLN